MGKRDETKREQIADEQYRAMVQQVKEYAVFMLDRQGLILTWNEGAERIKGYSAQEIIGRHFSIFYPDEDIEAGIPQKELEIAGAAGGVDLQGWRLRKDGSRFWAAITITALHDAAGNVTGFAKITRDITQRRMVDEALQKSRIMFERLFENSPDSIVVVDGNGVIRKVNQQAELLFGYRREELIGQRVELLIPDRFKEIHSQHRRDYFSEPRPRKMGIGLELYACGQGGKEFPVDIMLAPIETGEGTWAFAVVRDVTQQKQSEARISELNAQLKDQVDKLAASNRELEAFSYSVSHDLRAPLRHIIGFVDLLSSRSASILDDKSRHYMEVISDAARKMGELIDDLLSFSRMARTELMKNQFDLGELVREIVKSVGEEAKGREIEWRIGPLPVVTGDASLLRQVLFNLIANAVKFTRPRPKAVIEVGAIDQADEVQIFVKDNGVGFDPTYLEKLFGLFQRLHRNEEFEGTGVGLALVQRIIVRHGGRVWAEGTLDAGATFWFTLPKARPQ